MIWLGFGVVLPWRYALAGRYRGWAGFLLVVCTLLAAAWFIIGVLSFKP